MEKKEKELLFSIVKAGMLNQSLDLTSLDIQSDLMRVIIEQTFQPFLFKVSKDPRFKKYYLSSYLLIEQFEKIGSKLKALFDKHEIDHIFLKGYELRNLYHDKALRLSGDIDILVREKDYKKAKEIMSMNGFVYENECEHHAGYKYNNFEVELHRIITPSTEAYFDLLKYAFENAYIFDKHTYKLNNEFNFFYILVHYIKHLLTGAGLRELCDVYLMLEKLDLNMNKVHEYLKQFKLEKFFNVLLSELKILFDFDKLDFEFDNNAYELIDYSLKSGIHGNGSDGDRLGNYQKNSSKSKVGFLFKKLFLPVRTIFRIYPWTKSIILLPFGYIARLIYLLKNRIGWAKEVLSNKSSEDNIFDKIGL